MTKIIRFFLLVLPGVFPSSLWALSPMVQYQDLVAGSGVAGFADGSFYSAQFDRAQDLFLNPQGTLLYVADTGNRRIRVIDLKQKNQVKTLAGSGQAGHADGPGLQASFDRPTCLTGIPDGPLVVFDAGNHSFRLVDVDSGAVSTIVGDAALSAVDSVWNLVYFPSDQKIYFTEPAKGLLERFDLKTKQLEIVLKSSALVPNPKALALVDGTLFVADAKLPTVYSIQMTNKNGLAELKSVGTAKNVIALTGWKSSLYAYQADGKQPVYRIYPNAGPVVFESIGGKPLSDWGVSTVLDHFRNAESGDHTGFVSGPTMERRFYAVNQNCSAVYSFCDRDFGEWMLIHGEDYKNSGKIHDLEYPFKKPAGTFRILLAGRCFLYWQGNPHKDAENNWEAKQDYLDGVAKKLEAALNTQAALEDWPTHFEVLNGAMHFGSCNLESWPYYVLPGVVAQYDVDLVLLLHDDGFNFFDSYFYCPIAKNGIPQAEVDTEFALKTNEQKFGVEPMKGLIQLLQAKKKITKINGLIAGAFQQPAIDDLAQDVDIRKKIIDIMSLPLGLMKEKIESHVTSSGQKTRFETWLFPVTMFVDPVRRGLLKDAYENVHIPFVDLCDDFAVLGMSYAPFRYRAFESAQFTSEGTSLFTTILVHELIKRKEIPMGAEGSKN